MRLPRKPKHRLTSILRENILVDEVAGDIVSETVEEITAHK